MSAMAAAASLATVYLAVELAMPGMPSPPFSGLVGPQWAQTKSGLASWAAATISDSDLPPALLRWSTWYWCSVSSTASRSAVAL